MAKERESSRHSVKVRHKDGRKQLIFFDDDEIVVGRDEKVQVCIPSQAISRRHALIRIADGRISIRDLASSNGTFVGGRKLIANEEVILRDTSEEIAFGTGVWITVVPRKEKAHEAEPELEEYHEDKSAAHSRTIDHHRTRESHVKTRAASRVAHTQTVQPVQEEERTKASHQSLQMLEDGIEAAKDRFEKLEKELDERISDLRKTVSDLEREERSLTAKRDDVKHELSLFTARRDDAAREADELRADGDRQAVEAMKRVDAIKDEWQRYNGRISRLQEDTAREKAILLELQSEREKATTRTAEVQEEQKRAEASLNAYIEKSRMESIRLRERFEKDGREARKALESEISSQRMAGLARAESEARVRREVLEKEFDKKNGELEREFSKGTARLADLKSEIHKTEETRHREVASLQEWRDTARREREAQELKVRKDKALLDALEAEFKVKKLSIEGAIGDIELRQIESKRELERLNSQREDVARSTDKLKGDSDRHVAATHEQLEKLQSRIKVDQQQIERLKAECAKGASALAALKEEREKSLAQNQKLQEETKKAETALAEFRTNSEAEKVRLRAQIEEEDREKRKAVEQELDQLRKDSLARATAEETARKEALSKDFAEKGKKMERELADAKLREMEKVRELEKESEAQAKARRRFIVDDLVRLAGEGRAVDDLKEAFLSVLEGKTTATLNADAAERKHDFWKKISIAVAVPAAAVLLFVLFPGIPGAVKSQLGRKIASEKKDDGVFFQEIRQKGMKYQPPTDENYRGSYSDNILYLDGYVKMKLDEKEQTSWTLLLNDFIVGRLNLSDRVIPDFIASEDVMVKDLVHIRENILPQFKDQGLSRMADTEKQEGEKLRKLLETPENYQKFRDLEKSYYEDFVKRGMGKTAAK